MPGEAKHDPAALRALLARLEAASGPDRELDLDVWNALTGEAWVWREPSKLLGIGKHDFAIFEHEAVTSLKAEGNHEMALVLAQQGPCETRFGVPSRLTGSLDASVSVLDRFGMSWSKSMEGFVCVHDREGAGTLRPDTESTDLPIKLMAAAVRTLLARAETEAADAS